MTTKQIQVKPKKRIKVDSATKKLFATAKKLKVNLSDIAREVGKSRFHVYAVRDGEYQDNAVIDALMKLTKVKKAEKEKRLKALKKFLSK